MNATHRDDSFDIAVIGAGPAGANAAIAAADAGLSVILLDEAPEAGGQVWRAPRTAGAQAGSEGSDDRSEGDALRRRLADSAVDYRPGTLVWSVAPHFIIGTIENRSPMTITADRLIITTGATERVVPFPGWTLPGVFGLAAATALLKRDGILPGSPIVIAGQGPLLPLLACKALDMGLEVAAIVDRAGVGRTLRAAADMMRTPSMLARGAAWRGRIAAARVPYLGASHIRAAEGGDRLNAVLVGRADGDAVRERRIEAGALYVGDGLVAGCEITRLLGADHERDPLVGGSRVVCDDGFRTSIQGLYAAGDGARIAGSAVAVAAGRIAGLTAALDAGRIDEAQYRAETKLRRRRLAGASAGAEGARRLMTEPAEAIRSIPAGTVICRCEDVTKDEIERAVADGATTFDQLKHFTRCGMGPCQGRLCAANAGRIYAHASGTETVPSAFTPRTPLRPVSIEALAGDFAYDDIPVPEPAPL